MESLHKHWTQLKNITKARTDLATLYIQFLDESESLEKVFNEVELIIKTAPNEANLKQIEKAWGVIKPAFGEIKQTGGRVIEDLGKVMCKLCFSPVMSTLYCLPHSHHTLTRKSPRLVVVAVL